MKPISRILIMAGTGILFLICILIGVLYYRNLNRNEEEMAVMIERNLQQYLNERVNELNPEFLKDGRNAEKVDDAAKLILEEMAKKLNKENLTWEELFQYFTEEQINTVVDYIVNNFSDDWLSQLINEAGDTFITKQECIDISDAVFAALKEELLKKIEEATGEDREKLLAMLKELRADGENQIVDLKALIEKIQKENIEGISVIREDIKTQGTLLGELKKSLKNMNLGMSDVEKRHTEDMENVNVKIGELSFKDEMHSKEIENLHKTAGELSAGAGEIALQIAKQAEDIKKVSGRAEEIFGGMQGNMGKIDKHIAEAQERHAKTEQKLQELTAQNDLLKEKTEACFQSVSNGKALVASTITDLGVPTASDAAFAQISDHIKELYAGAFAAGAGSALENAKIEYVRHTHTGDAKKGGGCYGAEKRHTHNSGCNKVISHNITITIKSAVGAGPEWEGRCNTHGGCGNMGEFSYSDDWTATDGTNGVTSWTENHWFCPYCDRETHRQYTETVKICKYEQHQLLGYETNCGYTDGEILQAVITY